MKVLDVYASECPRCNARPNERCRFYNGKFRTSAHRDRVDAAEERRAVASNVRATGTAVPKGKP